MITLDRLDKLTAELTLADGSKFEVYGDSWAEIRADALVLADHLGITIDVFNSVAPDAA
jgi:hypothetical protein